MDRFPSVVRVAAAAWLAAGLGAVTSPVRADRPLQTEDAGILDRGDCEIELWHHTHAERDAPGDVEMMAAPNEMAAFEAGSWNS